MHDYVYIKLQLHLHIYQYRFIYTCTVYIRHAHVCECECVWTNVNANGYRSNWSTRHSLCTSPLEYPYIPTELSPFYLYSFMEVSAWHVTSPVKSLELFLSHLKANQYLRNRLFVSSDVGFQIYNLFTIFLLCLVFVFLWMSGQKMSVGAFLLSRFF